jgi:hypothetical protein
MRRAVWLRWCGLMGFHAGYWSLSSPAIHPTPDLINPPPLGNRRISDARIAMWKCWLGAADKAVWQTRLQSRSAKRQAYSSKAAVRYAHLAGRAAQGGRARRMVASRVNTDVSRPLNGESADARRHATRTSTIADTSRVAGSGGVMRPGFPEGHGGEKRGQQAAAYPPQSLAPRGRAGHRHGPAVETVVHNFLPS